MAQAKRIKTEAPVMWANLLHFTNGLLRETGFWLLVAVALGMVGALVTFNPEDPAWTHTADIAQLNNLGGKVGAWFADVNLYFFGYLAYLLPLGLVFAGWRLFKEKGFAELDAEIVLFRVLGFAVTLATACGLATAHLRALPGSVPGEGTAGGLVGLHVGQFLIHAFGFAGGNVFMAALLLAGVMLATGVSWLTLLDWIGAGTLKVLDWIGGLVMGLLSWVWPAAKTSTSDAADADTAAMSTDPAGLGGPATASARVEHASPAADGRSARWAERLRELAERPLAWWKARRAETKPEFSPLASFSPTIGPSTAEAPLPPIATPEPPASAVNVEDMTVAPSNRHAIRIEPVLNLPPVDVDAPAPSADPLAEPEPEASQARDAMMPPSGLDTLTLVPTPAVLAALKARTAVPPPAVPPSAAPQSPPVSSPTPAPTMAPPVTPAAVPPAAPIAPSVQVPWRPTDGGFPTAASNDPVVSQLSEEAASALSGSPLPYVAPSGGRPPQTVVPAPFPVHGAQVDLDEEEELESASAPSMPPPAAPPTVAVMVRRVAASPNAAPFPLPPLDLLDRPPAQSSGYSEEKLESMSRQVESQLKSFGVEVRVVAVTPGPVITRFEIEPAPGVKVSQISNLAKDLARGLRVISVRVVEVIPGKSSIGLEIPNQQREIVYLREVLESPVYIQSTAPLTLTLGKDIGGHPMIANLAKMPHLLVAGTTGSGKSVAINAMLLSLLYKAPPSEVRLILVDPKMLELSVYEDIPHLLTPVVTDMKEAANALRWCVNEMERRYRLMAALKVRNIAGFNRKVLDARMAGEAITDPFWRPGMDDDVVGEVPALEPLPFIVVVIDELADMMMIVGKKVEELIARLAQKARAAGIHLILATQRPSVDVITGLIKANIPTRIAFQVSSRVDSRTILDQMGAEQLLGHGDMLYLPPGTGLPQRAHGAFVDDPEVNRVVEYLRRTGAPNYIDDVLAEPREESDSTGEGEATSRGGESDPLYDEAVRVVVESRRASVSGVQRRLRIGYNRAARLVEEMEAAGVVGPLQSNGSREVLAPPPS